MGMCPYCGTYDNGTSKHKLTTQAEMNLCVDGHDWVWKRNKRTCVKCGYWERFAETDSISIDYRWTIQATG